SRSGDEWIDGKVDRSMIDMDSAVVLIGGQCQLAVLMSQECRCVVNGKDDYAELTWTKRVTHNDRINMTTESCVSRFDELLKASFVLFVEVFPVNGQLSRGKTSSSNLFSFRNAGHLTFDQTLYCSIELLIDADQILGASHRYVQHASWMKLFPRNLTSFMAMLWPYNMMVAVSVFGPKFGFAKCFHISPIFILCYNAI
ncbi:unnamed protein product, partial [Acanthocheilonema viteae]